MGKTIYVSQMNMTEKLRSLQGRKVLHVKKNGKLYSGGQYAITVK